MRRLMLAAVLLGAGIASAQAGVIRDDRADQLYLDLANQPKYASVGQFLGTAPTFNFSASGTLIAGDWVLTAAHVVEDATALSFNIGGASYSAASWVAHPNWNGDLGAGYDIALVKLGASPGITPATRYTGTAEAGLTGTFVGYGMTGDGLSGADTYDGLKRAGQNRIDGYFRTGKQSRIMGVDFDNPAGTSNVFGPATAVNLEYLISFGDSGGGVFIDVAGQTLLAGVHSFGADANFNGIWDDYGDYSGHTRVTYFNSWIDGVMAGASGGGGGKGGGKPGKGGRSFEFAAVPEPGSALLLAVGGLCLAARRATTR